MKKFLKWAGLAAIAAFVFTGCSLDDNDHNPNKFWITYATVEGTPDNFKLWLDNNSELLLIGSLVDIPKDEEIDGMRVVANFTIFEEQKNTDGTMTYYVRLNALEKVLTKGPVYSSQVTDEEMGRDPINIDEQWFSGKYLNVNFYCYVNDPKIKHYINLWVDEEHVNADENNVYVEIRHNAYGDLQYTEGFGRASFDVTELIPEGKSEVTLHIKWTDYQGITHTESGKFTAKEIQSGGEKTYGSRIQSVNFK